MTKLRQEFARTVESVGNVDERLVVLVGDISHGILQEYAKSCTGRYFNVGICEPTIMNMAAGLNKVGLIPVVHTIAPFITERAYEQIKLDFGYQELSVNIVSVGGSFDYAQLGCSHHCYTDVSLLSHLKRSHIFMPSGDGEFSKLFRDNYANGKINYFRLAEYKHGIPVEEDAIQTGKGIVVRTGVDVTVAVVGTQLRNAVTVSDELANDGISVEVIYFPTIKPFDQDALFQSVKKTRKLVVLEELSAHDGLYNLCIKATVEIDGVVYVQMAIDDFIHAYGSYAEICELIGLDAKTLSRNIVTIMPRKRKQ